MKNLFKTIELNITGLCNRKCSFCPHSVGYRGNYFLSEEVAFKLNKDLVSLNYGGTVTFAGNGEPLLHSNLSRIVKIVTDGVKGSFKLITNGDFLTEDISSNLVESGITGFKISQYDKKRDFSYLKNVEIFDYSSGPYNPVNRVEIFLQDRKELNINKHCFLPFYKLFLDYNGDVLLCCNDWNKKTIMGNILSDSIQDIWFSEKFNNFRRKLIERKRNFRPCIACNIDGEISGIEYFENFKKEIIKI